MPARRRRTERTRWSSGSNVNTWQWPLKSTRAHRNARKNDQTTPTWTNNNASSVFSSHLLLEYGFKLTTRPQSTLAWTKFASFARHIVLNQYFLLWDHPTLHCRGVPKYVPPPLIEEWVDVGTFQTYGERKKKGVSLYRAVYVRDLVLTNRRTNAWAQTW